MLYRSLNGHHKKVNFETAVKNGLAEDGGLFFPEKISPINNEFIKNLDKYSNIDIAHEVIKQFIGDSINEKDLKEILSNTVDFDFPLIDLGNNIYSLELFHGPTLAFKDVGARFMANCLGYFNKNKNITNTVLVATSGDTGSAAIEAVKNNKNVEIKMNTKIFLSTIVVAVGLSGCATLFGPSSQTVNVRASNNKMIQGRLTDGTPVKIPVVVR